MSEKSAIQHFGLLQEEIDLLTEECQEKLNEVEHDLMDVVEERALITPEFVNRVFRAFHSVKGQADFLGNDPLKRLSHIGENVLGAIREGRIDLSVEHAESLLSAVACLKKMAFDSDPSVEVDFSREAEALNRILKTDLDPRQSAQRQQDEPSSDHSTGCPVVRPPAELNSPGQLKILLVEDDFTSRVMLQGLLLAYGHCHIAVSGKEAVDAFRAARKSSQCYDLICMDVRMPEMDGTEAVQQIRAIEEAEGVYSSAGVKIFMTTAIRDLKTVAASYRALCDVYLFKPIDGAQLEQHMLAFRLIRSASTGRRA